LSAKNEYLGGWLFWNMDEKMLKINK
jgi:hypothetical protein